MKFTKLFLALCATVLLFSCSKDDDDNNNKENKMKEVTKLSNDSHSVVISSKTGKFFTGYNNLYVEVKDKSGKSLEVSKISWKPMMTMVTDNYTHSCPFTPINKDNDMKNTYKGSILFQMASMGENGYWDLTVSYTVGGKPYSVKGRITVDNPNGKNKWATVKDGYVFGLVQPENPVEGVNDMVVALYKMNMQTHSFDVVDGYKILIDPRMPDPSMGNHSSPNNVNLTQQSDGLYHGKVNFTMTGYWKINLQLEDKQGQVILGEAVTDDNKASSIYLGIEF